MSPVLRVGIVGLGNIGGMHARNLLGGLVPGMTLAAVCDQNREQLAAITRDHPAVRIFHDPAAMFESGGVDIALICTPHFSHPDLGIAALARGLHVLIEKPIAVHKADAVRLLAAPRSPGQVFGVMLNQRTNPCYGKLFELIRRGELGRINRIHWTITDWFRTERYYSSASWRATWAGEGGGVLLNQCPHQLDLWQWLFGLPARLRCFGRLGRFHRIEVEDDVTAYFEYADGCHGVFTTTTGEAPGTNRLEVAAERGKVVVEGETLTFQRNTVEASVWSRTEKDGFAKPPTETLTYSFPDPGEQHVGILKNFAAACQTGAPLLAPAEDGLASVELANAMLFSLLRAETVNLPLDATAYAALLQRLIEESAGRKVATTN